MQPSVLSEEDIFHAARQIGPGAARTSYLDEACGDNAELRRQVERLLAAFGSSNEFLESPAVARDWDPAEVELAVEPIGTQIGPYKLLEIIGEGGMGVVYLAEQRHPVERKVALKVVRPGMDTRQVLARFETERQALARMEHPNIARILDAGMTGAGRPYFVMDLVLGVPITEYCDAHMLSLRERLELFAPVCDAVQHAHRKGIIHRDLKPANILVTLQDGRPVPKVIDFGIAKAVDREFAERSLFTAHGQIIGTPQYMSPEQAELSGLDVDTRSDVFSLGVVLYELLTGTTPLEAARLRQAGFGEMQRLIRDEEPTTPSARLSTLGDRAPEITRHRRCDPKQLCRELAGDLDWVVMKALEKDRSRRYESPAEFAKDIQRYLAHEPVLAGPPSTWYRVRRLLRRHRAAVLAGTTLFLVLVGGIIGTTIGLLRALDAESVAKGERETADLARREADEAHTRTRLALETLTDNYLVQGLGAQSVLTRADRRFLERVEEQFRALATGEGDSEAARIGRASGHRRLARIRRTLGDLAGAKRSASESIALYEQLAFDLPDATEHRQSLAAALAEAGLIEANLGEDRRAVPLYRASLHAWRGPDAVGVQSNLANSLRMVGEFAQAERNLREVVAARTAAVTDSADAPRARLELAYSLVHLGYVLRDRHAYGDAIEAFTQSIAHWDRLVAELSRREDARDGRALASIGLASVYSRVRRFAEAEKVLNVALSDRRRLVSNFPGFARYQMLLAEALYSSGRVAYLRNRLSPAEKAFQESLAIASKLESGPLASGEYSFRVGEALYGLGLVAEARRDYATAITWLEQSRAKFAASLKRIRGHRWYAASMQKTTRSLVRCRLAQGMHAEAAALIREQCLGATAELRDAAEGPARLLQCAALAVVESGTKSETRVENALTYFQQSLTVAYQTALRQVALRSAPRSSLHDRELDPLESPSVSVPIEKALP